MKRNLFAVTLMMALLLGMTACSKEDAPLAHDSEIGARLSGQWQESFTFDTEISTDGDNPQLVTGTVTSRAVSLMTLNADQTFSIESRQEVVDYNPVPGTRALSQQELDLHFSQTVTVTGTFVASDKFIEFDRQWISVNGAAPVAFESYKEAASLTGGDMQRALWDLVDDQLTILTADGASTKETVYTRIN